MWSNVSISYTGLTPSDSLLKRARTRAHELEQSCKSAPNIRIYVGCKPRPGQKGRDYVVRIYLTLQDKENSRGRTFEGHGRGREAAQALERAFGRVRERFDRVRPSDCARPGAPSRNPLRHVSRVFRYRRSGIAEPAEKDVSPTGVENSNKGATDGQAA